MDFSPSTENAIVPVYIPDNNGEPVLHVGDASLKNDILEIKFNDSVGALLLERRIARGEIMGFSVINVQEQIDAIAEGEPAG